MWNSGILRSAQMGTVHGLAHIRTWSLNPCTWNGLLCRDCIDTVSLSRGNLQHSSNVKRSSVRELARHVFDQSVKCCTPLDAKQSGKLCWCLSGIHINSAEIRALFTHSWIIQKQVPVGRVAPSDTSARLLNQTRHWTRAWRFICCRHDFANVYGDRIWR